MHLVIDNKLIDTPIIDILNKLKNTADWNVFTVIEDKNEYIRVTCPFHKNGEETHPSCSIYADTDSDKIVYGTYHCFTCGSKGQLWNLVAYILGITEQQAKNWLIDNFGDTFIENKFFIKPLELNQKVELKEVQALDESILDDYNLYHPYMSQRRLTFDVLRKFKVGFNSKTQCLTFPVWDEKNNLVMITERSVNSKKFYIPSGVDKPVYLLNFIEGDTVYVTESQIDALTLQSYGYPAIALFGTGSSKQYEILKRSGIRKFILCFDGDSAGQKGTIRFIRNMPKDAFIAVKQLPDGKDINDLSKDEFDNLKIL